MLLSIETRGSSREGHIQHRDLTTRVFQFSTTFFSPRFFFHAGFVLQRAGAGDILAEASISTARYHCAAEAVADSVLAIWPAGRVRALLQEDHRAAEGYALHLAAQLRKERMRAEILSLRRVGDRLDAWLAWHDGKMPKKGGLARLAGDLNVSAPALYRELARRRAAGWAPG